jgi:hypothetical protein
MKTIEALMSFSPFLAVEQDCGRVLQWTIEQLTRAGLHTVQTFDLSTVRAGDGDCLCQDHGTSACDCQMVILFVYGQAGAPVALILHSKHGRTWLSFAEAPAAGCNPGLAESIQKQLEAQAPNSQSLSME